MTYLHKFYLFGSRRAPVKAPLFISMNAIDYMTWYKNGIDEGTSFHLRVNNGNLSHVVEGLPDIVNNGVFDGLFYKCTAYRPVQTMYKYVNGKAEKANSDTAGGLKKYSVWINPNNIDCMYMNQPDSTLIFFRSSSAVSVCDKINELMKGLLNHNKAYKERRAQQYGQT